MSQHASCTLDFFDVWLLEAVVVSPMPIRLLDLEDREMRGIWNRASHNMAPRQIIEKLREMFERRLIQFWRHDSTIDCSATEIGAELSKRGSSVSGPMTDNDVTWSLTLLGGAAWEQTTLADWGRYYENWQTDDILELSAGSCEYLLEVRSAYIDEEHSCREESIDLTFHRPWQATYWKRLPHAYRTTLHVDPEVTISQRKIHALRRLESWHIPSSAFLGAT